MSHFFRSLQLKERLYNPTLKNKTGKIWDPKSYGLATLSTEQVGIILYTSYSEGNPFESKIHNYASLSELRTEPEYKES
jgi:hypothetical protein